VLNESRQARPLGYISSNWKRAACGVAAGSIAGLALAATRAPHFEGIGLGVFFGVLYGMTFVYAPKQSLDAATTAAVLGIPAWIGIDVIVLPALAGAPAQWSAAGLRAAFPALVGWFTYGLALGAILHALAKGRLFDSTEEHQTVSNSRGRTRIIILGGGFAGVTVAEALERKFGADQDVDITLVSEGNSLLFTPMLAEVAGGSIEATHISNPIRMALHRTTFVRDRITALDPERRMVKTAGQELPYDHVVLALGATPNYFGSRGVEQIAFGFKTLLDAIHIRNHVIEMFESADKEPEESAKRNLLRFVIAGGGFAGVELAGALNDFARGMISSYPNLEQDMVEIVLVHGRDRVLPELSESLADYALKRLTDRGVNFCLGTHVEGAEPGAVHLDNGQSIASRTLVWTAGTKPSALLRESSVECDARGAVIVDSTLRVPQRTGIWALGDCAAVIDRRTKQPYPPTAQVAVREAETLAHNIWATIRRKRAREFRFSSMGALCVIGHQTACAELRVPFGGQPLRFSGFFAWLLWRTIYVGKLPGLERKIRVLIDWTVELFFPRDIVQTIDLK
jgi:NADH dehydrogenase